MSKPVQTTTSKLWQDKSPEEIKMDVLRMMVAAKNMPISPEELFRLNPELALRIKAKIETERLTKGKYVRKKGPRK